VGDISVQDFLSICGTFCPFRCSWVHCYQKQ